MIDDGHRNYAGFGVSYAHENYFVGVDVINDDYYPVLPFDNNRLKVKSVEFASSINNYDIINELGESNIRKIVGEEYEKWLASGECGGSDETTEELLNRYIKELSKGYKDVGTSTDYKFYIDSDVKVFQKELKNYNGLELEYIALMPRKELLSNYIKNMDKDKISNYINDLKSIELNNFEKGKIALQFEYYTENEEAKAMLKKQEKATTKLNTTFLKYFPASTIAFMNIGANGEELYNLLQENEEFRNTVSISKAEEVKALFASFNGDISAGLINITMGKDPAFVAYADVKNGNALKALYDNKKALNLKRGEDIVLLSDNEYVYKSRAMNIFFGFKDNQMYATNDELLYKNIGKAADKSIKDTGYVSDMKGKNFFFVINMDAILELPIVKMMTGFGGEEYQTYYNLASQVSYLEVSNVSDGVSEVDLILKNKDTNSLKQIVDFVKKFTGM